ncbi:MAG: GTP pyrophosphokinase family protein [Eubacteriales bacterium]|nr:GTP pyrophosphokinase family protein [Eubacteriales bacterium]
MADNTKQNLLFKNLLASLFEESDRDGSWQKRFTQYNTLMAYYKCAMMEVETKFNVLNQEYSIQYDRNPINSIRTRLKSLESITEKLEKRNIPFSLESLEKNLNDVAGIRVICSFQQDVYTLADALLSQDDITLLERKDYIANPKSNGYRSLHLIVSVPIFLVREKRYMRVEIQLRTIAMDSWASLEHQLRYKKDFEFTEEMVNDLYYCSQLSASLDEKMDKLRNAVNPEHKKSNP